MSFYDDVREFHEATDLDVSNAPVDIHELQPHGPGSASPLWRLRYKLVTEEFEEFRAAMFAGDLVAIADAICDLHYVLSGTSVSFGIPEDQCFAEVQRSNMSKIEGGVIRRDDGKILKGENFSEPDLESIIYPKPG